jgi:hypothetical protein
MSFRRHIMNTPRSAKREALRRLSKTISSIPDGAGDGARDAALNQLQTSHWLIMSDTAGTPAAKPDEVQAWIGRGPEKVLRDAREFLTREADLAVDTGGYGALAFADRAMIEITRCLAKSDVEDVHVELMQAAEFLHNDLKRILNTHEVASPDTLVIPLRELCGLDGQPDARGKEAGDVDAAIEVSKCLKEGLRLEAEARELERSAGNEDMVEPA